MRTSTLVEDMPHFEIRDGLLHITGNVSEFALPLAVVRRCLPAIAEAIAAFDSRGDNVIPAERLAALRGKFIIARGEAM